jgi:hypothetical protein
MSQLDVPETTARNLQRILDLKVIGMCVGGCSLLSALILLLGHWSDLIQPIRVGHWPDARAFELECFLFVLGVSLLCLGWVKALQQMQLLQAISDRCPHKKQPIAVNLFLGDRITLPNGGVSGTVNP